MSNIRKIGNQLPHTDTICHKFFKEFKDEDLIRAGFLLNEILDKEEIEYLETLNNIKNTSDLKKSIQSNIYELEEIELNTIIEEIKSQKTKEIPISYLKKLENNNRELWFLLNVFLSNNRHSIVKKIKIINPYFLLLFHLYFEKNELIKTSEIDEKIEILKRPNNPMFFLKKYIDNEDFISWALNQTQKKYRTRSIPSFTPKNIKEELDILLGYWDFEFHKDEYKYLNDIKILKKAWQQKEFRDKGGLKKPYHLPLTKKAKSQLEALAEKMDISESKTLERLIEDAYNHEMLDNKGKNLY